LSEATFNKANFFATDSQKLEKVKAVIIICQTSNQIATTEENYCGEGVHIKITGIQDSNSQGRQK
jgi:hypothetical protein